MRRRMRHGTTPEGSEEPAERRARSCSAPPPHADRRNPEITKSLVAPGGRRAASAACGAVASVCAAVLRLGADRRRTSSAVAASAGILRVSATLVCSDCDILFVRSPQQTVAKPLPPSLEGQNRSARPIPSRRSAAQRSAAQRSIGESDCPCAAPLTDRVPRLSAIGLGVRRVPHTALRSLEYSRQGRTTRAPRVAERSAPSHAYAELRAAVHVDLIEVRQLGDGLVLELRAVQQLATHAHVNVVSAAAPPSVPPSVPPRATKERCVLLALLGNDAAFSDGNGTWRRARPLVRRGRRLEDAQERQHECNRATGMHAPCNSQRAKCNMRHATGVMQQTTFNERGRRTECEQTATQTSR